MLNISADNRSTPSMNAYLSCCLNLDWWWCLRYCLLFSVSIKKGGGGGGGPTNDTDKMTKL